MKLVNGTDNWLVNLERDEKKREAMNKRRLIKDRQSSLLSSVHEVDLFSKTPK